MTHAKQKRQPMRQFRVLMLSTLTVLLCGLLSQAQSAGPLITGPLIKGGTTDYIPLWKSDTTLTSSKLFQSTAGDIGVGTTTPAATLDVNGAVNAATSYNLGENAFAFGSFTEGNAFLGFAGNSTMTGIDNTASGFEALHSNTSGYLNTVSGYGALYNNTTGYHNTVMGSALYSNTTGYANTAIGNAALFSNTTGVENTAVGASALSDNSTACCNTATGYGALAGNTTGTPNTATGTYALYSNTTGTYNTATGYYALEANSTGTNNTTSGTYTLANNTTGGYDTAVGVSALADNTTGIENTAIGAFACQTQTTGTDITCTGYATEVQGQNVHNATAIGAHASVSVSDAVVLGSVAGVNGATATARVGIGTTTPSNLLTLGRGYGPSIADGWTTYSSRRWKTNIQTLHGALEKVERLRGVSYDLKANGQHEVGVIAEEVGAVVPELVTYEANGKDARGVDYSRLTALLIEATKEQQALLRHQQKLIRAQQAEIRAAQIQNTAQQAKISQLASQVQTIQVSLSSGRPGGFEIRTASVRGTPLQ